MHTTATNPGKEKIEAIRGIRSEIRQSKLNLWINCIHLGKGFVPISVEIIRTRIDSLILVKFDKGQIDDRHSDQRINHRAEI